MASSPTLSQRVGPYSTYVCHLFDRTKQRLDQVSCLCVCGAFCVYQRDEWQCYFPLPYTVVCVSYYFSFTFNLSLWSLLSQVIHLNSWQTYLVCTVTLQHSHTVDLQISPKPNDKCHMCHEVKPLTPFHLPSKTTDSTENVNMTGYHKCNIDFYP